VTVATSFSATLKWIAARLKMGTWKHLNRRLHEPGKPKEKYKVK